ncbi:OmpA family protein [Acuticoccus sp. I52.16.1]|uniref:OmpA family protein n=1 Tax=Acuticoccus sp. I52.16.1 TaxID=2928472 RepID=UPI001FD5C0EC|nr:OmpA family protein [Acuticoccus sp. I52.16.1]UOM35855.1 OmpA family protein [Acuticoccus sp. I52.16.1]
MHAPTLALALALLAFPLAALAGAPARLAAPSAGAGISAVQFGAEEKATGRAAVEARKRELDRLRHARGREQEERRRARLEALRKDGGGTEPWRAEGAIDGATGPAPGGLSAGPFGGAGTPRAGRGFGGRRLVGEATVDGGEQRRAQRLAAKQRPARTALAQYLDRLPPAPGAQAARLAREENQRLWESRAAARITTNAPGREGALGPLGMLRWGDLVDQDERFSIFAGTDGRNTLVANRRESRRFHWKAAAVREFAYDNGWSESVVARRDGSTVRTLRDANGVPIRRSRVDADGAETMFFNNLPIWLAQDASADTAIAADAFDAVPAGEVDAAVSSLDALYRAATAEPSGNLRRAFTLNQILTDPALRGMMPAIDVDTITFETNSATLSTDELAVLELVGASIAAAVAADPREVFLIEGHTDAQGHPIENMKLSDERAEAVARLLTEAFDIPPENFVTHGYGEEALKVETDEPDRRNRRVTVRRITPLLTEGAAVAAIAPTALR